MPNGVSLSSLGLTMPGGRTCADGEPHEAHTTVLGKAIENGSAETRCMRCSMPIRIVRMEDVHD